MITKITTGIEQVVQANYELMLAWGCTGWVLLFVYMVIQHFLDKNLYKSFKSYQESCDSLLETCNAYSELLTASRKRYKDLTDDLARVAYGEQKSFTFRHAKFRLCNTDAKRDAKGKFKTKE